VNEMVGLLVAHATARLAILGPGGIGKTTVALALLHEPGIVVQCGERRFFISCEALIDADSIVVSLAKLLGLQASGDPLTAVVACLSHVPRVVLVLDNLETVWLVRGAPVDSVDELLGRIAEIPTLSLIITCRSCDLPQLVQWSNTSSAVLKPFSLAAALLTFQDRSGHSIKEEEQVMARELLSAVDMMPLAVSLLGQLARRGNSVFDLLDRWNRKRTALLWTYRIGRFNNVGVSVELSITMMCSADDSETRESLKFLSLCCILPDGLRKEVFIRLRPHFEDIEHARDNLIAYSLASLDADGVLKMLSPIRHHVLERHPADPIHHEALCSIYLEIAQQLPTYMDEHFKERAAIAAPEINNLSSLLLTLVHQPSQEVVKAVNNLTSFSYWQQPSVTVALALVLHLEPHPKWKARCLRIIGTSQGRLGDYQTAIDSLSIAAKLFLDVGDHFQAAWCKRVAGGQHRVLGQYDQAEAMMNEARQVYLELRKGRGEALCRRDLGELMRMHRDDAAAIMHLSAARHIFNALGETLYASQCTQSLGAVYLDRGDLESALREMETARLSFARLGAMDQVADTMRTLGDVRRRQGELGVAEQLLSKAETIYSDRCHRIGLANCAGDFGYLRIDQGRRDQAIAHFKSAHHLYKTLGMNLDAEDCGKRIEMLKHTPLPADDNTERP